MGRDDERSERPSKEHVEALKSLLGRMIDGVKTALGTTRLNGFLLLPTLLMALFYATEEDMVEKRHGRNDAWCVPQDHLRSYGTPHLNFSS